MRKSAFPEGLFNQLRENKDADQLHDYSVADFFTLFSHMQKGVLMSQLKCQFCSY